MICRYCGAPLKDHKCEYCGAEYEPQLRQGVKALLDRGIEAVEAIAISDNGMNGDLLNCFGELNVNGETIRVYISDIANQNVELDSYTDMRGFTHRNAIRKRKFTLVEV